MSRELSQVAQTVRLRSLKPNPTWASPYSSRNRCLNRWSNPRFDGDTHRESSQGSAARRCREEARQRYSGGCRVGLECRASLLRFGEAWGRCLWRSPEEANTVNLFELLGWVAMSPGENGLLLIPVTIPRRLCACRVTPAYKVYPKWLVQAAAQRTLPQRPLLQGYQQRRSSHRGGESLNLSEQGSSTVLRGIVSPVPKATKWLDRVPSRSTLLVAKKHSQIARRLFPCGGAS